MHYFGKKGEKAMHKLKKLIAFTLIISLLVTIFPYNIQSAYAAGGPGYVGGSTGNSAYERIVSRNSWSSTRQGIRVSIVDKNGKNVLLEQGVGYGGIDILFFNPGFPDNRDNQYNKFGESGKNEIYEQIDWDTVSEKLKQSAASNPYLGTN